MNRSLKPWNRVPGTATQQLRIIPPDYVSQVRYYKAKAKSNNFIARLDKANSKYLFETASFLSLGVD